MTDRPRVVLNEREIRVLNYMLADWREPHRVTNIEQAVAATNALGDVETRKRIGRYLVKYLNVLDTTGNRRPPLLYVLTNNDAIVARHLLQNVQVTQAVPDPTMLSRRTGLNRREVLEAYDVLNEFNFLDHEEMASLSHYRLSPRARELNDDMNFTFAEVGRADGTRFNVNCARDAMELALTTYAREAARISAACAHCPERMQFTVTRGALAPPKNEAPWLLLGDNCLNHLLFKSEAHCRAYLSAHPDLKRAESISVRDYLLRAKSPQ